MSASRDRKEAAKVLGIALQVRYRKMLDASTNDEISIAAVDLGKCFNDNIEFIIWALRTFGGESLLPAERVNAPTPRADPLTTHDVNVFGTDMGRAGGDMSAIAEIGKDGKMLSLRLSNPKSGKN